MKILLDECLPVDLRYSLTGHEANTVEWAGFKGKKERRLTESGRNCRLHGVADRGSRNAAETNAPGRKIAILLLVAPSNQMEDLLPLDPDVLVALQSIQPGQVIRLGS